jgi:HPr kinase/phosphorylase
MSGGDDRARASDPAPALPAGAGGSARGGDDRGIELTAGALAMDPHLSVGLRRVAGESGLERPIRHPRVQKCGLALAGHYYGVVPTRVQVLGETELSYLDGMTIEGRGQASRGFLSLGLSCVVVTRGGDPPRALVQAAEATATPLFVSDERSSRTINALHAVLDDRLAPQTTLHGVLVDVFGIGLLLLGKSGIGKSECALELVLRGHRLVADDVVKCDWRPPGMVFGGPADLLRHHIEVRGLGVLNIKDLFGVTSVSERKRIDVVIRLAEWNDKDDYDRLGVEEKHHTILGQPIRMLTVPVRPGRDMGSILEIAARNELLRRAGNDTPRLFLERIEAHLGQPGAPLAIEPESIAMPLIDAVKSGARSTSQATGNESSFPRQPGADTTWTSASGSSTRGDRSSATESSAWIPAVRRTPEDDE